MPVPPCGIPRHVFYDRDMVRTSQKCWDNDYIPCATKCKHLKSLIRNYWNKNPKCEKIHQLANHIPHEYYEKDISPNQAAFPNRQDCGKMLNGNWKSPKGEIQIKHHSSMHLHSKRI